MKIVKSVDEIVNSRIITPGDVIYCAGNAATPQVLLSQLAADKSIKDVDMYCVLPLGENVKDVFCEKCCERITHRVIFNSYNTREAVNKGWAYYHPLHLNEIPRCIFNNIKPDIVFLSISGPDQGGNYSLGTTVEGVLAAIEQTKQKGGKVIAELNKKMPFVLGTTVPESQLDYIIETDYDLPISPVHSPDERARRIGEIIAALYIDDGSGDEPGTTLQYGIGEVPEAVTDAIIRKGVKDLAIHTELFAGAMAKLVKKGIISNKWKAHLNFSVASIFLGESQEDYDWLNMNSAVQSRPANYTNSVFKIAEQPKMVSINSAIGVDLHGNIWADSLDARKIYSGVGGQTDFVRGSQYSKGGMAIIALKSSTEDGISKIIDRAPSGITYTATTADKVILVTEYGALDPRGLSLGERAVGIAHLAHPEERDKLLSVIYDSPEFHKPVAFKRGCPTGFIPYEKAVRGFF